MVALDSEDSKSAQHPCVYLPSYQCVLQMNGGRLMMRNRIYWFLDYT